VTHRSEAAGPAYRFRVTNSFSAGAAAVVLRERTDPVILGHILTQHRELHGQISAAREAFAAGHAEARAALAALREHLAAHFRQEERGGFLEESITRLPRLGAAAAAVLGQHGTLLAELDGLIERLAVPHVPASSWERVGRDFEDFCGHLLAHERTENAVVQEGFNEDLGLD